MKKVFIGSLFVVGAILNVLAQSSAVTNAILYHKDGELDKAKEYIDQAVAHEKTSGKSKTWYWSGQIHHDLGIKKEDGGLLIQAEKSYSKSIELNENAAMVDLSSKNKTALFRDIANIAVAKHQANDVEAAMGLYDVALLIQPNDTNLIGNATIAANDLKNYDKVIELNSNWANQEKASVTPHYNIIKANVLKEDKENALKACETALQKYPVDKKLLTEKSNALISLNRADEAVSALEKMMEVDPNNAMAITILGSIYFDKDREKAVGYYLKALEINNNIEDANFNLGSHYFNLGADKLNKVNDMTLTQYQKTGKKLETDGKALMEKSIPYFEKVNEIVDKDPTRNFDPETIKSLITAYQKVGRAADSDKMSKILYGE